jgi:hypothetical protein
VLPLASRRRTQLNHCAREVLFAAVMFGLPAAAVAAPLVVLSNYTLGVAPQHTSVSNLAVLARTIFVAGQL